MEARVKGNLETFIETQAVQRGLKERLAVNAFLVNMFKYDR